MAPLQEYWSREEAIDLTVRRYGWISSPDTRGTMDIIWPCLSAIVLMLWSMLHLNVPAPSDSDRTIALRRIWWLLLGLLAPELVMMFAFAQLTSAQQSVEDMKALGKPQWSLTHGFYADSGGFRLHARGCKSFPITAKQIVYLVQQGILDGPDITEQEINDKSKADGATKVLAFFQTGWLTVKLVGRAVHGLQITPFELTTLALLVCSFTTLVLWWNKPLGVQTPTPVYAKEDMDSILTRMGGEAKQSFTDTPLEFIECDIYWSRKASKPFLQWVVKRGLQKIPLDRIPNDRDYHPHSFRQNMYLVLPVSTFVAIHLAGYNLSFPNEVESMIWRVNSIIMTLALHIHCVSEALGFWWTGYKVKSFEIWGAYKKRPPLCFVFVGLGSVYFISRIFLLVEAVISLRSLPESAFVEISWSQFLPRL